MIKIITISVILVWSIILFYYLINRKSCILLVWLLIAPVASNIITDPGANPFFAPERNSYDLTFVNIKSRGVSGFFGKENAIRAEQLIEPTRILFCAFFLVFLSDTLLRKRYLGPFDRTEIWMGIFIVLVWSNVFLYSQRLHWSMRIACDAFTIPFISYFVVRRIITSEELFNKFVKVLCYMGCFIIVITLIERLVHSDLFHRLGGPFKDRGSLYTSIIVVFFITLSETIKRLASSSRQQILPPVIRQFILYLSPIILILTWTRAYWVGFFVSVLIFAILSRRLIHFSWKIKIIGLTLILLPILGFGLQWLIPEEIIEERVGHEGTIYGRLATWKVGLQEGIKNPLFGIGLQNLRFILNETRLKVEGFGSYNSIHNSYIAFIAELGIIGTFAYLIMVVSIIKLGLNLYHKGLYPQVRWHGVTVVAIMMAYLVVSIFAAILHDPLPLKHVYIYSYMGGIAGLYSRRHSIPPRAHLIPKGNNHIPGVMGHRFGSQN